uniref:Uncharacterized protein n=1 Tax=Chenopodium quinoa TaxID=63459 RepID=A0A803M898_CHEQI
MAATLASTFVNIFSSLNIPSNLPTFIQPFSTTPSLNFSSKLPKFDSKTPNSTQLREKQATAVATAAIMFPENPLLSDVCGFLVSAVIARTTLGLWELTAKFDVFDSVYGRGRFGFWQFGGLFILWKKYNVGDLEHYGGTRNTKQPFSISCFCTSAEAWEAKGAQSYVASCVFADMWELWLKSNQGYLLSECLLRLSYEILWCFWVLFGKMVIGLSLAHLSGYCGAFFACLVPGVNIIRVLLIGLGIYKDEATVKSMSRFGDYRELLKGPLYYASTITFACFFFWRTSPIGIAAICNLCAGDGLADIVGRRLGKDKLPYNENKSYAGTIAMAIAGFVASVGYMHYFSLFGFLQESWDMVLQFLVVSLISALVESLPISTQLDDNLTVPLASFLAGSLLF